MHYRETYKPANPDTMAAQQKADALNSLIFLTEKQDEHIKSCMCDNGSKQRRYPGYKKEDSVSPTVSLEGVMLTSAIEAHEQRY